MRTADSCMRETQAATLRSTPRQRTVPRTRRESQATKSAAEVRLAGPIHAVRNEYADRQRGPSHNQADHKRAGVSSTPAGAASRIATRRSPARRGMCSWRSIPIGGRRRLRLWEQTGRMASAPAPTPTALRSHQIVLRDRPWMFARPARGGAGDRAPDAIADAEDQQRLGKPERPVADDCCDSRDKQRSARILCPRTPSQERR